jgi:hypothetical protein
MIVFINMTLLIKALGKYRYLERMDKLAKF